jgi:signal transduction histidine kinase/CheY-like chemotaxis protein/HPt (histidine-containing phosphotransfer) domain-containing protein
MPNTSWVAKHFRFLTLVNPTLLSATLAMVLLFFFTNLALRHIHSSQERIVREHLQTSLNSFTEIILLWQQQNHAAIQLLANSTQGKALLTQVLLAEGANENSQEALREWLSPVLIVMGFEGFSVINHDRVLVAASGSTTIKQPVQLPEILEVLDKALAQRPAISRPVASMRSPSAQSAGSLIQLMCVLFESGVATPGYFCLHFNAQSSFSPLFFKGRTGRSGEIYAIDHLGRFITPERFAPDAMEPYLASRNIIIGLSVAANLLILLLTITAIVNRKNLEKMIQARTQELMSAKDDALAASHSKAEFLANMSHEIRTPLNAILGLAHIALASKPELKQRIYLEKMRDSGEHLLQIINDILSFSRMEAGKLTLDHSELSIAQLVDKTVDLVWEKAAEKGLQVNVDIDPHIPKSLLGDSLRLGQILINFCANAVKFTDHGSISIRVTKVRDWQDRVELLFEVEDTGIGIDAEKLQNLFQPFQQVDSSSTRRFEGTGLGLSICKKLADLMQARIDVKTTAGRGSCFRLHIQLEKNTRATSTTSRLTDVRPKNVEPINCNVLVVEDNLLNQEIILSLLEYMGATAVCVGSGADAIAIIQRQVFDVVLMDIQLPGMDGVETTARIRELPEGKQLPIIAVTANALPGDKEAYFAAGMDDYLSKPIAPAQLHRALEKWAHGGRGASDLLPKASSFDSLHKGGIDTARALHNLMDNEALYLRLLERFARERADFPAQLATLLRNNPDEALNQVHSLKSLAGSLGMSQLEMMCFNLEQQLHVMQWDSQLVNGLNKELTAMVELVGRCLLLNGNNSPVIANKLDL